VPTYAPRRPTQTVLYGLVREHLASLLQDARESYAHPLPQYVKDVFHAYLRCGVFAHGFARLHCNTCNEERLLAFSCKGRAICPSCSGRRMANTAAHLVDRVLPRVPVRQYVLSLPFDLRMLAAFRADVLTALSRIFFESIRARYRKCAKTLGRTNVEAGAVTFVQRFGSSLNLNVHFHVVVLDGVFSRVDVEKSASKDKNESATFHAMPPPTQEDLATLLAQVERRVQAWLRLAWWQNEAPDHDGCGTAGTSRRLDSASKVSTRALPWRARTEVIVAKVRCTATAGADD
jgi:hypothetical protein